MKILIVDNSRDWVEMLASWLKNLGYEVCRAYTGEQAQRQWLDQQPDLVILDPALKDMDGLDLCRQMRPKHDALVLIITDEHEVRNEVRCLESGADDYVRKPFSPTQLLARIHAVHRRARSTLAQRPPSTITIGPICVDSLHNEARVHGKAIRLTRTESKLLHLLASNADDVCTAEQIITYVWGYDGDGGASLIKAHIRHLRQKLEPEPAHPRYILTVPGVGYTFVLADAGILQMKGA
jgi:DNA-binding response OmpR family regulator